MSQNCAVPGCGRVAPGSFNDFCPAHHFQIPKAYTDMVRKTRIAAFHAEDATKQHLEEQCAGYVRLAASKVPGARRA